GFEGTVRAALRSASLHGESDALFYLHNGNACEFLVWLNEQKLIWRLQLEPLPHTLTDHSERSVKFSGRQKEIGNHLIENQRWRGSLRSLRPHVNTASLADFDATSVLKLPISGAG